MNNPLVEVEVLRGGKIFKGKLYDEQFIGVEILSKDLLVRLGVFSSVDEVTLSKTCLTREFTNGEYIDYNTDEEVIKNDYDGVEESIKFFLSYINFICIDSTSPSDVSTSTSTSTSICLYKLVAYDYHLNFSGALKSFSSSNEYHIITSIILNTEEDIDDFGISFCQSESLKSIVLFMKNFLGYHLVPQDVEYNIDVYNFIELSCPSDCLNYYLHRILDSSYGMEGLTQEEKRQSDEIETFGPNQLAPLSIFQGGGLIYELDGPLGEIRPQENKTRVKYDHLLSLFDYFQPEKMAFLYNKKINIYVNIPEFESLVSTSFFDLQYKRVPIMLAQIYQGDYKIYKGIYEPDEDEEYDIYHTILDKYKSNFIRAFINDFTSVCEPIVSMVCRPITYPYCGENSRDHRPYEMSRSMDNKIDVLNLFRHQHVREDIKIISQENIFPQVASGEGYDMVNIYSDFESQRNLDWESNRMEASYNSTHALNDKVKYRIIDLLGPYADHQFGTGCGVCGGASSLAAVDTLWDKFNKDTDVDIFIWGSTAKIRRNNFRRVCKIFSSSEDDSLDLKTTYQGSVANYEFYNSVMSRRVEIQVIFTDARRWQEVVYNFDMTHIQSSYNLNEKRFYASPEWYFSMYTGQTIIIRSKIRSFRLEKAIKRGFTPVMIMPYTKIQNSNNSYTLNSDSPVVFIKGQPGTHSRMRIKNNQGLVIEVDVIHPKIKWHNFTTVHSDDIQKRIKPNGKFRNSYDSYYGRVKDILHTPKTKKMTDATFNYLAHAQQYDEIRISDGISNQPTNDTCPNIPGLDLNKFKIRCQVTKLYKLFNSDTMFSCDLIIKNPLIGYCEDNQLWNYKPQLEQFYDLGILPPGSKFSDHETRLSIMYSYGIIIRVPITFDNTVFLDIQDWTTTEEKFFENYEDIEFSAVGTLESINSQSIPFDYANQNGLDFAEFLPRLRAQQKIDDSVGKFVMKCSMASMTYNKYKC
jgi:hypothetical protein